MVKSNAGKRISATRKRAIATLKVAKINATNEGVNLTVWKATTGATIARGIKALMPAEAQAKISDLRLMRETAQEEISALIEAHAPEGVKAREIFGDVGEAFMSFMVGEGVKEVAGVKVNSLEACDRAIKPALDVLANAVKARTPAKANATEAQTARKLEISANMGAILAKPAPIAPSAKKAKATA